MKLLTVVVPHDPLSKSSRYRSQFLSSLLLQDFSISIFPIFPMHTKLVFFIFQETNFKEPLRIFSETELDSFNMHYYSAEVHKAAFILPRFARKALDEIISNVTEEANTGDR
jgi:spermidine synthase